MDRPEAEIPNGPQGVGRGQDLELAFPFGRVTARGEQLVVNVGGVAHDLGDAGPDPAQNLDQDVQPGVRSEEVLDEVVGGGHTLPAQPLPDFR